MKNSESFLLKIVALHIFAFGHLCYGLDHFFEGETKLNGHDGLFKAIGALSNGLREGEWYFFHPNGKLYIIQHYSPPGVLNGQHVEFYENGVLGVVGQWKDGKHHGYWIGFHENGKIRFFANYPDSDNQFVQAFSEDGLPKRQGFDYLIESSINNLRNKIKSNQKPKVIDIKEKVDKVD